jgi:hypothetical protein
MPTALNPLFVQTTLPTTSQAAIREFNDRYLAVLGASMPTGWADTLGDLVPTDRPMVTFPVSMMRTFYQSTEGGSRFKKLREKSFDVFTAEYDDGYEARLIDLYLQVFAYRQWQQAPERLVKAEEQFRHLQVAALLTGGTSATCVDGTNFFGTTHPVNMTNPAVGFQGSTTVKTWSNYVSATTNVLGSGAVGNAGPFTIDSLEQQVSAMRVGVPDENGVLLGANPDTILVPEDYAEALTIGLANNRMMQFNTAPSGSVTAGGALDNTYKGRFNVQSVKEFSLATGTTADWYLIDSKMLKAGIMPWVSLRQTVPTSLALRVYDEASDYFKDSGNIKLSSHIWYGFSLALPHAIRRITGPTR